MVVRSNMNSMYSNRQLGKNNNEVATSLKKLASGYEINSAADNSSGLAVTQKMQAQITGLEQGTSNAEDGISLIQTAEGAMGEIHNMLNRMVELATKSANGTIEDAIDREAIQAEVEVLTHEVERIANFTNFNGITLFDGSLAAIRQSGSILASGAAANDDIIGGGLTLHVGDTSSLSHTITVYVDALSAEGLGLGNMSVATQEDSSDAITLLKEAINQVSTNRANVGAINNRLEYSVRSNTNTTENMASARSKIGDTDMASSMMEYTKMNVMTEASQSMLAHSNQNSQQILELLG